MRRTLRWFLFLLTLFVSLPSFAQQKDPTKPFNIANAFYDAKEYDKAIPYYQEAYDLSKKAPILFNIGQCYRLIGNKQKALEYYERFLKETSPGESTDARVQAEQFVAELKVVLQPDPIVTPPTTGPTEVGPTTPTNPNATMIHYAAPAGIAAVGLGVGSVFGIKALKLSAQLKDAGFETVGDNERGRKLALTSDIATLTGLVGAGVVFFVTRPKKTDKVSVSVGPSQIAAQLSF